MVTSFGVVVLFLPSFCAHRFIRVLHLQAALEGGPIAEVVGGTAATQQLVALKQRVFYSVVASTRTRIVPTNDAKQKCESSGGGTSAAHLTKETITKRIFHYSTLITIICFFTLSNDSRPSRV